jgi:hypothetical protein
MSLTRKEWDQAVGRDRKRLWAAGLRAIALRMRDAQETAARADLIRGYPEFRLSVPGYDRPVRGISFVQWDGGLIVITLEFCDQEAAALVAKQLEMLELEAVGSTSSTICDVDSATDWFTHSALTIRLNPFTD